MDFGSIAASENHPVGHLVESVLIVGHPRHVEKLLLEAGRGRVKGVHFGSEAGAEGGKSLNSRIVGRDARAYPKSLSTSSTESKVFTRPALMSSSASFSASCHFLVQK